MLLFLILLDIIRPHCNVAYNNNLFLLLGSIGTYIRRICFDVCYTLGIISFYISTCLFLDVQIADRSKVLD